MVAGPYPCCNPEGAATRSADSPAAATTQSHHDRRLRSDHETRMNSLSCMDFARRVRKPPDLMRLGSETSQPIRSVLRQPATR